MINNLFFEDMSKRKRIISLNEERIIYCSLSEFQLFKIPTIGPTFHVLINAANLIE
jgi:hypothetical protein